MREMYKNLLCYCSRNLFYKQNMKTVISVFIFCIVLFIYLHIQFQLKVSNDLEMYDLDNESTTKEKFEEICDLRQPVLFSLDPLNITTDNIIQKFSAYEIKIRNVKDAEYNLLPLSVSNATKLFENDTNEKYLSENNADFLKETGLLKEYKVRNKQIQPPMTCHTMQDIIFGSAGVETPLRYAINYRNFYTVSEGSVQLKLFSPYSDKHLDPISDYENFEFRTLAVTSGWNIPENIKDKVKCIEFILTPGKAVYIPAYWWYSMKLGKDSIVHSFQYRTYMNYLAIFPNICMYFLQNLNVKREIVKKMNIDETIKIQTKSNSEIEEKQNLKLIDE